MVEGLAVNLTWFWYIVEGVDRVNRVDEVAWGMSIQKGWGPAVYRTCFWYTVAWVACHEVLSTS